MAVFTCNQCGGLLELNGESTVVKCRYCDVMQTVPRFGSDKHTELYRRAQEARCRHEFDRAMSICDTLINDDAADSEAYWQLALCRYGVIYEQDPASGKHIPTVNRSSYTLLSDDNDFKSALECADDDRRAIYMRDAEEIDDILSGIIEISRSEEPFDVFICYKETAADGSQTEDSALAFELYNELVRDGLRVFFSRVTLESKLGCDYEPYIFAALHSAKVMVVLGTSTEYFEAPWVKNEWSRYLALIRAGEKKTLVPAYKYITAYDLPPEMQRLQGQDLDKISWKFDLCAAIKKFTGAVKKPSGGSSSGAKLTEQLKRGKLALEDREWKKADEFYEAALNYNAECAEAYLGKFLAKVSAGSLAEYTERIRRSISSAETDSRTAKAKTDIISKYAVEKFLPPQKLEKLFATAELTYDSETECREKQYAFVMNDIIGNPNITKAQRFAAGEMKNQLQYMTDTLSQQAHSNLEASKAADAQADATIAQNYSQLLTAAEAQASQMYDSVQKQCERTYVKLTNMYQNAKSSEDYKELVKEFNSLAPYKDSIEMVAECRRQAEDARVREETEARERAERERRAEPFHTMRRWIVYILTLGLFAAGLFYHNQYYYVQVENQVTMTTLEAWGVFFLDYLAPAALAIYLLPFIDIKRLVVNGWHTKKIMKLSFFAAIVFSVYESVFAPAQSFDADIDIFQIIVLSLLRGLCMLIISLPKLLFDLIGEKIIESINSRRR